MGNKKLVTLWLCWIPLTIDQGFPNAYPHHEDSWEEGKAIKKDIKQEIKQEVKSEPASTPKSIDKRPRPISTELSIRKRPGIVTCSLKKVLKDSKALRTLATCQPFKRCSRAQPAARQAAPATMATVGTATMR